MSKNTTTEERGDLTLSNLTNYMKIHLKAEKAKCPNAWHPTIEQLMEEYNPNILPHFNDFNSLLFRASCREGMRRS